MKIHIDYKGKDYQALAKMASLAYAEVAKYFDKNPKSLDIRIHKTRQGFEEKLQRKTQPWEVANAAYSGSIDILHPNALAKESTHDKEDFKPLLKHEIAHLFLDILSRGYRMPKWLDEGFSSYVAGFNVSKDLICVEENFCKVLGTPKGWDEHANYYAYNTAQMFVRFLIKEYSIKKVTKLISSLEKNYYYGDFDGLFTNIFGQNIDKTEKSFIRSINGA
ncbi:MAG: hypothetical protein WC734_05840 [Patescibacteria group bacterium]|jgi:hypothetical protein